MTAVNSSLEELNLAHNVDLHAQNSSEFGMAEKNIAPSVEKLSDEAKDNQQNEVIDIPQSSNAANIDYTQLEVADSEDESVSGKPVVSKVIRKYSSAGQSSRLSVNQNLIQELTSAISKAKNLKFLNLSNNGFSTQDVELLYSAWSATKEASCMKHFKDNLFQLSTQGVKCLHMRPCCRRDAFS